MVAVAFNSRNLAPVAVVLRLAPPAVYSGFLNHNGPPQYIPPDYILATDWLLMELCFLVKLDEAMKYSSNEMDMPVTRSSSRVTVTPAKALIGTYSAA